jgi:hypothetical protein
VLDALASLKGQLAPQHRRGLIAKDGSLATALLDRA